MEDLRAELLWVMQLTEASGDTANKIVRLHKRVFGIGTTICQNCPDQLRLAVKRLTHYYNENYK